jgi:hypothetical protein
MGFFPIKKIFWWFFPSFFQGQPDVLGGTPATLPVSSNGSITHKKPRALTQGYNRMSEIYNPSPLRPNE